MYSFSGVDGTGGSRPIPKRGVDGTGGPQPIPNTDIAGGPQKVIIGPKEESKPKS
ncbi:MAG: hypothetical protein ACI9D5_001982 [Candidatus Endobugula sp.]